MAIPANKTELLEAIAETYSKLKAEFTDIPKQLAANSTMEGHAKGTEMSVNNLLAYLIGWGELVLKWERGISQGKEVMFPEEGYKWTQLGPLAQKFYQDYTALDFLELQWQLDRTLKQISDLIEATPADKLYGEAWYGKYPMGRMIQLNTSSPYKNARTRLRKWKKTRAKSS